MRAFVYTEHVLLSYCTTELLSMCLCPTGTHKPVHQPELGSLYNNLICVADDPEACGFSMAGFVFRKSKIT